MTLALVMIAALVFTAKRRSRAVPPSSQGVGAAGASAQAATYLIIDTVGAEVPVGQYFYKNLALSGSGRCSITGRVVGVAGGAKDVRVLVLDADEFRNFQNGTLGSTALFDGGAVTSTTLGVNVDGPGTYYLVVWNGTTSAAPKTVQAKASITCR